MLLAFLRRALLDTEFSAWNDHETEDVGGLVDGLIDARASFAKPPLGGGNWRSR